MSFQRPAHKQRCANLVSNNLISQIAKVDMGKGPMHPEIYRQKQYLQSLEIEDMIGQAGEDKLLFSSDQLIFDQAQCELQGTPDRAQLTRQRNDATNEAMKEDCQSDDCGEFTSAERVLRVARFGSEQDSWHTPSKITLMPASNDGELTQSTKRFSQHNCSGKQKFNAPDEEHTVQKTDLIKQRVDAAHKDIAVASFACQALTKPGLQRLAGLSGIHMQQ